MKDTKLKPLFSSQKQNWKTPKEFYDILDKEFQFTFDPCPEDRVIKVFGALQSKFDGLSMNWGERNFVNPPYNQVSKWIKKGFQESQKGKLVVFLIPARTDTKWFHELILPHAKEIRFIKGRLQFIDADTNEKKDRAPFPSMLIIFDKNKEES